jgi:hypothetical protein
MKAWTFVSVLALASLSFAQPAAQSAGDDVPAQTHVKEKKSKKHGKGTAAEIGGGVGSVAGGVAKGAGSAATGVGKGALDLATLHPIDAGAALGTGAVKAGKDVTVGSVKGVGKIGKGVGHLVKKVL